MKKALHGISFSPAGLLTPFHFGASYRLQELGLLTSSTALAGASGGAIASVMSALFSVYQEQNISLSNLLETNQSHHSNRSYNAFFIG